MRKIAFALMLMLASVSSASANYVPSYEGGGSGTDSGDALWIVTASDLARLRNSVNDGEETPGRYYVLSQDIHITDTRWEPIGNQYFWRTFRGHFDGNGKTIHIQIRELPDDDAYINSMDRALFGSITADTSSEGANIYSVRNLKVSGIAEGYSAAGIVSLLSSGIIEGCTVSADIAVYERDVKDKLGLPKINAGGIAAIMRGGTIRSCDFIGNVYAESRTLYPAVAGGITGGMMGGKIADCTVKSYSTIAVDATYTGDSSYSYLSAGGIAGFASLSASSSSGSDSITGCVFEGGEITSPLYAGGITGYTTGGRYTNNTIGEDTRICGGKSAGGIIGTLASSGYIYSNDVQGGIVSADSQAAGGIVGVLANGTVQNNASSATIRGNATYKGGVIGVVSSSTDNISSNRYKGADYGIGNLSSDTGCTKLDDSGLYFVTPATLPSAIEGEPYSYTIELSQAATVNLTPISSWMSPTMNATNTAVTLSGTPDSTDVGETSFTLTANSGSLTSSRTFTINVTQQLYIDDFDSVSAVEGEYVRISPDVIAQGNDISGVSFTWAASGLPSWLSIDASSGLISGIADATGTYDVAIQATPDNGLSPATASITIYVSPELDVTDISPLPDGRVARSYAHTMTPNLDSSATLAWSVSGSLPDGLSLDVNTGKLYGTPTKEGDYTFTIHADSGNVSSQKTFTLTIAPAIIITTTELPYAFIGEFYSQDLTTDVSSGTSIEWEISSSFPAGLSFDDGRIAGIVSDDGSVVGDYTFNVKITAGGYTNSKDLTLNAVCFKFSPDVLPGAVYGAEYSHDLTQYLEISGVSEDLITWSADELPAGLTLSESGDISGIPTVSGDYEFAVRAILLGDYFIEEVCKLTVYDSVTVVVSEDFAYTLQKSVEVSSCGFTISPDVLAFEWSVSGNFPGGLSLGSDTGIITGTPSEAGVYEFTVQAKAGDYTVSEDFTLEVIDFFISSISQLPEVATGHLYSFKFTAQGLSDDLIIWSADKDELPEGLTFYNSGVLVGTTQAEGTYTFTVEAMSGAFKASQEVTLIVSTPITIKTDSILPNAAKGVSYSLALSNDIPSGRSQSWQVIRGTLPGGLSLDAETGVISGIPETAGIYPFTVQVTAGKTASKDFTLSVLGISTSPDIVLPDATKGEPYSYQLSADITAGDSESPIWAVNSGTLPEGLTLSASGLLAGTPMQAGTTAFNVSAFVSNNVSSDLTLTLTVNPSDEDSSDKAVNIITSYLPLGEIGKEYSARLEANPSGASWTLSGDTLPTGLTLNADGTISGIPTQTGSFIFRVKASYPSYTDGEIQLTISVTQDNGGYSVIIGSSGGGCDSGMGTATLLLSFMAVIAKRKR